MRQFRVFSEQSYARAGFSDDDVIEEVSIGDFNDDGSCVGSFRIEWVSLLNQVAIRIVIFDDAFLFFSRQEWMPFWSTLSSMKSTPSVDELASSLERLGFKRIVG